MKKLTYALGFMLCLSVSEPSRAEWVVGNGGDGLKVNGKVYLLDLVEAGVEEKPYFDAATQVDSLYLKNVELVFSSADFPVRHVAWKLGEVRRHNSLLADLLFAAMRSYSWHFVAPDLLDIEDEHSPLHFPRSDLVQIANRSGRTIRINRSAWALLDEANKAALVFHEMLYALAPLREISPGMFEQDSVRTREITGFIFSTELSRLGATGLARFGLPMAARSRIADRTRPIIEASPQIDFRSAYMDSPFSAIPLGSLSFESGDIGFGPTIRSICRTYGEVYEPGADDPVYLVANHLVDEYQLTFEDFMSPLGPRTRLVPATRVKIVKSVEAPSPFQHSSCMQFAFTAASWLAVF